MQIFIEKNNYSKIYGYFCTGFTNFMLINKILIEFFYLFSPNNTKDIIIKYLNDFINLQRYNNKRFM